MPVVRVFSEAVNCPGRKKSCSAAFPRRRACAFCYILWNQAVDTSGPIRTNLYIYLNPVITLIASTQILKEPIIPDVPARYNADPGLTAYVRRDPLPLMRVRYRCSIYMRLGC